VKDSISLSLKYTVSFGIVFGGIKKITDFNYSHYFF
jgi:hypothetical protein